jgi:membrane associated rhomboid family serine protease
MFIIPIGTKSSLALTPKLTIGLIAANVLVAIITVPLMIQTESDLFRVQRVRFARQIELYLDEHPAKVTPASILGKSLGQSLQDLESAKDFQSFQAALSNALAMSGVTAEAFQNYERILRSRGEDYYLGSKNDAAFSEWRLLRTREETIVARSVLHRFGLVPSNMSRIHTFFTHQFIHAGIWHLLGNMLFLWVVGCLLEDSWGRLPFLVSFLAGGAVAGLIHCYQDTSSTMPLVGASGAIAAAMGAFTIRHFWTKIKFFYFFLLLIRPYAGTFYLPAFVFLPFWFAQQVALHYLDGHLGGVSNVAYMAHIAGFTFGILTALAMRLAGFEERFLTPSVQKTQVAAGVMKDPRFNRACELLTGGNVESARLLFNKLLADRPDDLDLMQDIAMFYREKALTTDYAALIEKALKLMILKDRMEDASRLALDMLRAPESTALNGQYLTRVAKWLAGQERYGDAHDIYRSIITSAQPLNIRSKAYVALATLLVDKMGNTKDALTLLEDARSEALGEEWLDTIVRLEQEIKSGVFTLSFKNS